MCISSWNRTKMLLSSSVTLLAICCGGCVRVCRCMRDVLMGVSISATCSSTRRLRYIHTHPHWSEHQASHSHFHIYWAIWCGGCASVCRWMRAPVHHRLSHTYPHTHPSSTHPPIHPSIQSTFSDTRVVYLSCMCKVYFSACRLSMPLINTIRKHQIVSRSYARIGKCLRVWYEHIFVCCACVCACVCVYARFVLWCVLYVVRKPVWMCVRDL